MEIHAIAYAVTSNLGSKKWLKKEHQKKMEAAKVKATLGEVDAKSQVVEEKENLLCGSKLHLTTNTGVRLRKENKMSEKPLKNIKIPHKMYAPLKQLTEDLPFLIEYAVLNARLHKAKYDALIYEGFTETQALELSKKIP